MLLFHDPLVLVISFLLQLQTLYRSARACYLGSQERHIRTYTEDQLRISQLSNKVVSLPDSANIERLAMGVSGFVTID